MCFDLRAPILSNCWFLQLRQLSCCTVKAHENRSICCSEKEVTLAKHILLKICQKVIYMLLSPRPPDSAYSHFESARECQRSTSPGLSTTEITLILFFIWFCCEFSSWFPSHTLETTVLRTFPVRTFQTICF